MSKKHDIETMQKWARSYNGACLSEAYVDAHTKLQWQCSEGHIFWKRPNSVQQGSFCSKCNMAKRAAMQRGHTITDMQKIAYDLGGECLSEQYINNHIKLLWKCKRGHEWNATPNGIMAGKWCRKCAYMEHSPGGANSIEAAQKLAKLNDGKLLSTEYLGCMTKLQWQCSQGHIFEKSYNSVQQGQWCPVCANNKKHSIVDVEKFAAEKNYKLLSNKYINAREKLKWQCLECQTIWECVFGNMLYNNSGCPTCSHQQRIDSKIQYNINDLRSYAQSKKGFCKSIVYLGYHQKHIWECEHGHIWHATPANILRDSSWCPYCKNKNEQKFREVIEQVLDNEFPQKYPKWLLNPKTGHRLQLDGYNEEMLIAFEYQGYQHFDVAYYDKNEKQLEERQARDKVKKSLCKKHGVKLICPTYELDEDEFEEFIKKELGL